MTSLFCVDFPPLRIIEQHVEGLLDWSEYWKLSRAFGRTYLCDVYSHVVLCDWCSDWGIRSRVERTLNLAIIPGECVCVFWHVYYQTRFLWPYGYRYPLLFLCSKNILPVLPCRALSPRENHLYRLRKSCSLRVNFKIRKKSV